MHSSCGCFINNKYFRKLLLFVAMLRLVAWRRVSEVDTFVVVVYVLSLLPLFLRLHRFTRVLNKCL